MKHFISIAFSDFLLESVHILHNHFFPDFLPPSLICNQASSLKLMKRDISKVEYLHIFPPGKTYLKKYWEKIKIDTINLGKLFDTSAERK